MSQNQAFKENTIIDDASREVSEILDILDQIESHTANLRKKLVSELKSQNKPIHLDLDNV